MSESTLKFCLVLLAPPSIEEKLVDLLLGSVGNEVFTSVPTFSHGTAHGRFSAIEQVMGRSAAVQMQIVLTEPEMSDLLERLRSGFRGTGLRYWASPLALEGEVR
jgi:Protein of unknown function (DUF3240)